MEILKELLLKEQERLEQILRKTKDRLADAPQGDASFIQLQRKCPVLSLHAGGEKKRHLYS